MIEWFTIENVQAVDTPALIVFPDRVKKNLAIVRTFIDDITRLRPHVKTHKCPEVARMMLDAGITKFKCATIAEAEMLAAIGARDVLLAYQPLGPKVKRFCDLQMAFPDTLFSCLTDHSQSLQALSEAASASSQTIRVLIDMNIGMNRTGILPGAEAFDLYQEANAADNIEFLGLHAYDGHIREPDLAQRTAICNEGFHGLETLALKITEDRGKAPLIVAGGTPTYPIHANRKNVEASPGTFIFWDKGYQMSLSEQPFEFAALVLTRVVSKPTKDTICVDLGHKSIAAENPLSKRVHFLNAPGLEAIGHSEEHMVWRTDGKQDFEVGDVLYGVPHHICPTVALYDEAAVCHENRITDAWPILARKRKITI